MYNAFKTLLFCIRYIMAENSSKLKGEGDIIFNIIQSFCVEIFSKPENSINGKN